jgi:NADH-quinone oxidoreductase subunit E
MLERGGPKPPPTEHVDMAVRRLAETQPDSFAFTRANQAWAERQIAKFPQGRQASAVIPLLWRAQEQEGWVTKPAIERVAEILGMPTIRVLEVATFYTMFHLEPVGRKAHIQVCGTTPCMLRGAGDLIEICRERINEHPHHCSGDGSFSWEEVECLGACVNAPMVQISKDTYEDLTPETFESLLDAFDRGEPPMPGPQNGRQYSVPMSGLTSLIEIQYADDDVREARTRPPHAASFSGHASQESAILDQPRPGAVGNVGGESLEAEQQRRKGRSPEGLGGKNPAGVGTADQEIGRVDPSGRSDEAAARSTGGRDDKGGGGNG